MKTMAPVRSQWQGCCAGAWGLGPRRGLPSPGGVWGGERLWVARTWTWGRAGLPSRVRKTVYV